MSEDMNGFYTKNADHLIHMIEQSKSKEILDALSILATWAEESIANGGTIFFFGNGGSAAEATHLAAEFMGHCVVDHHPWRALSLNDSMSAVTAISNDYGPDEVFARQLRGLGNDSSLSIGLSTSGASRNVIHGLETAKTLNMKTALFTSTRFVEKNEKIDLILKADSQSTPRIQEIHLLWGHTIAEYVEQSHVEQHLENSPTNP